jgi:glucose/arabinose dehydrogenase
VLGLAVVTDSRAATLPPGFQETVVVETLGDPRAFAWAPDGDLWILMGYGYVFIYRDGILILAGTFPVRYEGEGGANGIALDPDYMTNRHIWVYYKTLEPFRNRVSRFTNQGDVLVDETVMLDGPLTTSDYHNGGGLRFASDKTLFITMGDDTLGGVVAQDPHDLRGKVLRIDRDGTGAAGNPYLDGIGGDPRVWAIGFRNPYRFNFQPQTDNLFIGDVGAGWREEIDIGLAGGNFGWPFVEGDEPPGQPGFVYPIFAYDHSAPGGEAVIGGDHAGPGDFAPEFEGDYFFADWGTNRIFRMTLDASNNPTSTEVWGTDVTSPVDVQFGPDGSLYYVAQASGIRKISYVAGANRQPVARATVSPDSGPAPLTTTLDGSSSSDPDQDPLTYAWELGDGNQSTNAVVSHDYPAGVYAARLTVHDGQGGTSSAPAIRIVSGNNRPTATITSPADESHYDAGQSISYSGTGVDSEEGTLSCAGFTWKVTLHHETHVHPFLGPIQGNCSGSFVTAERGETSADTHYEVVLTVQDGGSPLGSSATLSGSHSIELRPNTSSLTLVTNPLPNLQLTLDGQPFVPPQTVAGVVNFIRAVGAADPQPHANGHVYRWLSWSDGGAREHEIRIPSSPTTYTATFGCNMLQEVPDLRLGKGAGGEILLTWAPVTDACLALAPERYRIHASSSVAPSSPPGDFPDDPSFAVIGTSAGQSFSVPPGSGDRFFLLVAMGTDGAAGPVGHYGQ